MKDRGTEMAEQEGWRRGVAVNRKVDGVFLHDVIKPGLLRNKVPWTVFHAPSTPMFVASFNYSSSSN